MYNTYKLITLKVIMEKICSKCKQLLNITLFSRDKYKPEGYRSACKKCSALEFKKYKLDNSESYLKRLSSVKQKRAELKSINPIQVWAHCAYHNAKSRAARLNLDFTIGKEWLVKNAPTHCPLLKIELSYSSTRSNFNCASLDRINSYKGYTEDNCKIISFKANRIKSNATLDELETLAHNMRNY